MVFLFWFEVMPFKIAKMIMSIFLFTGEKSNEEFIPEMVLNILLVWTLFSNSKQRVTYFKTLAGNILRYQRGIIDTSAPVTTNINNKMVNIIFLQCPE